MKHKKVLHLLLIAGTLIFLVTQFLPSVSPAAEYEKKLESIRKKLKSLNTQNLLIATRKIEVGKEVICDGYTTLVNIPIMLDKQFSEGIIYSVGSISLRCDSADMEVINGSDFKSINVKIYKDLSKSKVIFTGVIKDSLKIPFKLGQRPDSFVVEYFLPAN
jgi:dihydroxyacetone kinase-like predicted kinase